MVTWINVNSPFNYLEKITLVSCPVSTVSLKDGEGRLLWIRIQGACKSKRIEYILEWNLLEKSVKRPFCCTVSILFPCKYTVHETSQ